MGLVWWLKVTALGPEHASVGQPVYDRVTRQGLDQSLFAPGPAGLRVADPGAPAKDHATGSWPMSAYVLISRSLFRAPEQRTSKAGKPFVIS
jgi:hypothetical protein